MSNSTSLAIAGGQPVVTADHPHFVWPPAASKNEKQQLAAQRDLDINIIGNSGPVKELEDAFAQFLDHQVKHVVTFNSGSSALLAAYFGLGIGRGDEVICPALTYHATASPLYFLQANPVLVDVDDQTWNIDPNKIEAAITSRTKAVTVVHQWGHPAEMRSILAIARRHNLAVIEDCSHAHGSRYQNQAVGTFGDVAVFSLQAAKMIFAGEGGVLVTNNTEVHDRAIMLGHYRDRVRDEVNNKFYRQFWVTGYGLKLRMSPFNAIVALHAVANFTKYKQMRHKCLHYFSQQLAQLPELTVPIVKPGIDMGAWYGYKPRYKPAVLAGVTREKYIAALQAEGVEVKAPGSMAFSLLPLFTIKQDQMFADRSYKKVYSPGDFPVAEEISATALSLPTFTHWPSDKHIIDQYLTAFRKVSQHFHLMLASAKS